MRSLKNKSIQKIDVGIIANSTSLPNRQELIDELGEPKDNIFSPLKFSFGNLKGHIIPLDIQPKDIFSPKKMPIARKACLRATDLLVELGAKTICYTASTKRLPGKDGIHLREKPYADKVIFSIGDSATTMSFLAIISEVLKDATEDEQILVVGGGFLGLEAVNYCSKKGRSKNLTLLSKHSQKLNPKVRVVRDVSEVEGKVKLLIVCAHKHDITAESLEVILQEDSIIVDVAVPAGVPPEILKLLKFKPTRLSAGDFFLENIDYQFQPGILCFPSKNFWYGCFTEALCLAIAIDSLSVGYLKQYNFFQVNEANQVLLFPFLKEIEAKIPLVDFFSLKELKDIKVIDF